jgi:cytochrome c553
VDSRNFVRVLFVAVAVAIAAPAWAQGNAARGRQKADECASCHGPDGNSENPEWPKIAGLDEAYIVAQLRAFQTGGRDDMVMAPLAEELSEQDMRDLAAFYASKRMQASEAGRVDKALAEQGRRIYRDGIAGRQVAACMTCHGPAGDGDPAKGYTRVGGQHAPYIEAQLQAFRTGRRADPGRTMGDISERMSDEEIRAVALYVAGLSAP